MEVSATSHNQPKPVVEWDKKWSGRRQKKCRSKFSRWVLPRETLKGKKVLNVGAGDRDSQYLEEWLDGQGLKETGGSLVVVDISKVAMRRYRRIEGKWSIPAVANALRLPFKDQSFEVVVSVDTLGFLGDNYATALREIARVLVPGGHLVLITPHADNWQSVKNAEYRAVDDGTVIHRKGEYFTVYDEDGIAKVLQRIGLEAMTVRALTDNDIMRMEPSNYLDGPFYPDPNRDVKSEIYVEAVKKASK